MATEWEYKVVLVSEWNNPVESNIDDELNKLGRGGWELCGIVPEYQVPFGDLPRFVLKRPKGVAPP